MTGKLRTQFTIIRLSEQLTASMLGLTLLGLSAGRTHTNYNTYSRVCKPELVSIVTRLQAGRNEESRFVFQQEQIFSSPQRQDRSFCSFNSLPNR